MLDCDQRGLEKAYDSITEAGLAEPALFPVDLAAAGPEIFDEMLAAIEAEFGGLDAVVHCAARFEGLTPLDQVPPAEWLMQMQVNLNAAWLLSVQSLPLLRQSRRGHLYFLLDDPEKIEGAFWGAYGISKQALRALISQLSAECRTSNIQVLGIDPGPMRSAFRSRAYHSENPATQPDPGRVAGQIASFLTGKDEPESRFVDLKLCR